MSQNEQAVIDPYNQIETVQGGMGYDYESRVAKENLDLQAIGELLEDAETAEEFEYRLNSPENGVNNLDLNGDGYVDYISVREFDERDSDERGFSLFSMFGPEMIQEIATIIFDRDRYNNDDEYYPGSRVLITGNEQIYGDNYYYETNWLERSVPIVTWLFTDRDNNYSSPYYYENYPEYYEPYTIVETPVYRTRIEQYYSEPVFIQTAQPTVTQIKIKSPYRDKSLEKVYSKMAKPTKQQVDFRKNNPGPPEFVRERKERKEQIKNAQKMDKPFRDKSDRFERKEQFKQEKQQMRENQKMREKPNKPEQRVKFERQNPVRIERQQPQRIERQQPNFERQKPAKVERQQQIKPQQQMKPQKQENRGNGGGNPNKGGGNPNKGNGGGGGGKKGKG